MTTFFTVLVLGLLLGGIYGLVSIGLNLIFGVIRIVNFAHGETLMLAMYATYFSYAWAGINPYLAIITVAPLMFVFGVLVQRLLMQPLMADPIMQIFASFGLMIFLQNIVLLMTDGQPFGLPPIGISTVDLLGLNVSFARLVALVAVTLIAIGLHVFLHHTMSGKAIRAVTQDKRAAAAMGINVDRIYLMAFGLGCAVTGVAGCLLTPVYTLSPTIGSDFMVAAFAVVVLGGLGSIWGAYIGGLAVGIVEVLAGFYIDPSLRRAIWFLIFIAVLVARPAGLMGTVGAEEVGFRERH
jgi:branched-chain amino acid transport system permease protein